MQPSSGMMLSRRTMSEYGLGNLELARRLGFGGRRSGGWFRDLVGGGRGGHLRARGGGRTTMIVRNVGGSARDIAHRVGPRRGILGVLLLGGAIVGSVLLVRRMRRRREERGEIEGQGAETGGRGVLLRKRRRAMNEYIASTAR
jgi:hypothetical protein